MLDTTKQAVAFLTTLEENYPEGVAHEDVVKRMKEICSSRFGDSNIATSPRPLLALIESKFRSLAISEAENGCWIITERGSRLLRTLNSL